MWKGGGVAFGDGGINNLNSIILAPWNVFRLGEIQFRLGEIQKNRFRLNSCLSWLRGGRLRPIYKIPGSAPTRPY